MSLLDQRRIPGLSRLYADYLYNFERVNAFYPAGPPFDLDRLAVRAAALEYPADRRRAMAALLDRQNRSWTPPEGLSEATAARLREFAEPGTVAVVSGQQVGLGGGPLLALYKAMEAVVLAERLRGRGIKAVPVFWMATQDHDLAEIDHLWLLDPASRPVRLQAEVEDLPSAPVGSLRLRDSIAALLAQLGQACGFDPTAPPPAPLADLSACYRPGATLADAFAGLFARWFAPWGLILFDPLRAPEAASLWAPYFQAVVDRQPELSLLLRRRGGELEAAGYHAQVDLTDAATLLFFHHEGRRVGLRREADGGFLLGDRRLAPGEVREWLARTPEAVSPSALLRPLMQDVALPTLLQVTGPAETAYLAQSAVVYPALGLSQPVVWPRASLTLLDPKSRRLLDRNALSLEQIWQEPAEDLLARRALPAGLETQVGNMRSHFDAEFARLTADLTALDPTLVDAAQGAVQKIRHQLEQLEARVVRSFARRSEEITSQAQHLSGSLYPDRHLQERQLGLAGWVVRYPNLPALLHDRLNPLTPDHQLLDL